MKVKTVWQCGHCGRVYKKSQKADCDECCDNRAERGYLCTKCDTLYSKHEFALKCSCMVVKKDLDSPNIPIE